MRDTRPDCSNFDYLNNCFECDTPLIGPLCPACNPRTGYSRGEIRLSAFTGMIVGMVVGVVLTHLL